MCEGVGVDTNLWEYAYVDELKVAGGHALHQEAKAFLRALLADVSRAIVLSAYQAGEILGVLRKVGLPADSRQRVHDLLWTDRCQVVPSSTDIVKQAFALSEESGIHIYDYLVALPLRGLVQVIYTADRHFEHPHFQQIARIENPLSWVMIEGQPPRPRT